MMINGGLVRWSLVRGKHRSNFDEDLQKGVVCTLLDDWLGDYPIYSGLSGPRMRYNSWGYNGDITKNYAASIRMG